MDVLADLDSTINELAHTDGAIVTEGDVILTLDCMKMLIGVQAPRTGAVTYTVCVGDYVQAGSVLARID